MSKDNVVLQQRKPTRLKNFDYSTQGAYFLTICTEKRKMILSNVTVGEGLAPPEISLKPCGKIAEEQLLSLKDRYPTLSLESYVIMPNHIHMILFLQKNSGGASPSPTISDIVCSFKSLTSRICKEKYNVEKLFQRSFMDHIIRDREDYRTRTNYIIKNPSNWICDELYAKE